MPLRPPGVKAALVRCGCKLARNPDRLYKQLPEHAQRDGELPLFAELRRRLHRLETMATLSQSI